MSDEKNNLGYGWLQMGPLPINVAVVNDKAAYNRLLRNCGLPKHEKWDASAAGRFVSFVHETKPTICAIYFPGLLNGKPSKLQAVGVVAHECAHVWQEIRIAMGEAEPSPEFEAYTIQALVQDTLAYLIDPGIVTL